jgi:hypothetical protein
MNTSELGISFTYESGTRFGRIEFVDDILADLKVKNILYIHVDPEEVKFGSWDLIIVFTEQEKYDCFKSCKLLATDLWQWRKAYVQQRGALGQHRRSQSSAHVHEMKSCSESLISSTKIGRSYHRYLLGD